MKSKIVLPLEVKKLFVSWGAMGGSSKSQAKKESSRKNGMAPCKPGKTRGRPIGSKKKLAPRRLKGGNGFQNVYE